MLKKCKSIHNPLFQALENNLDLKKIKNLLKTDKNLLLTKNKENLTPLMIALKNRCDFLTINYLIKKKKTKINEKSKYGKTALIIALENFCDEKIIELLIKKKSDLNVKNLYNKNLYTPLMICVMKNYSKKIFEIFLKQKKLRIDEKDKNGFSAIMYVLKFKRDFEIFKILVEKGANLDFVTKDGKSCFFLALKNKCDKKIILFLLKKIKIFFYTKNYLLELALIGRYDSEVIDKMLKKDFKQKKEMSKKKKNSKKEKKIIYYKSH